MNPVTRIRNRFPALTKEQLLTDLILALMESDTGDYDPARFPNAKDYVIDKLRRLNGDNQALEYLKQALPA